MLSLDPVTLADEVQRAEDFRRKHIQKIQHIARRFVGNWFREDHTAEATPENTIFAYIAYMLPELWYANPACRVTDNGMIDSKEAGDAMEEAVKSWIRETAFTREGQQVVRDALIGFGGIQVGLEPRDWPGDRKHGDGALAGALRPFAVRFPPERLILDPMAETVDKARFLGHSYDMDRADLQADVDSGANKWDAEAVAKINEWGDGEADNERAFKSPDTPERHRVQLVDLWIPEHNRLITLARNSSAAALILRDVEYWGPPEGPYEIFGFYDVPGDPYPLSPIMPIMEQLEELWAHQRQASEEASSYKRFALVEGANTNLQKAIMAAKSGDVAAVSGFTGQWAEVQLGGSPEGRLQHIMTMRDRADRTIGLSDAQRGRISGKTATETDVVQGNVDTRTSYMRQRIQFHTTRVLRRVGWYMFKDPAVVMPVKKIDPMSGQEMRGIFQGGEQPGQEHLSWSDYHLDIEPTSMQHSDDAVLQQRALESLQVAQQVGELRHIMPDVNWRAIVNMYGESFNQKNVYDIWFQPMPPAMPMGLPGTGMQDPAMAGGAAPGGMPGGGAAWGQNGSMAPDGGGGAPPFAQQAGGATPGGPPMLGGGARGPMPMGGGLGPMRGGGPRGAQPMPGRGAGPMVSGGARRPMQQAGGLGAMRGGGPRRGAPVGKSPSPMMKGGAPRKSGGHPFMFIGKGGAPRADKGKAKTLPMLTGGGPRANKLKKAA